MRELDVLLTGEGADDYGWREFGSLNWEEGAAAKLIHKCAKAQDVQIHLAFVDRQEVERVRLQRRSMQGLSGKAIPARKFYRYIRENKYFYGIYYCDADRSTGSSNTVKEAKKRFKEVYEEVEKGANPGLDARRIIPMIALRMIESWLLSDKKAFEIVYGEKVVGEAGVSFPAKPEYLWGKEEDPQSNYPKNYLKRICQSFNRKHKILFDRRLYADLAEQIDIEMLCEKCPVSFGTFRKDFDAYLAFVFSSI